MDNPFERPAPPGAPPERLGTDALLGESVEATGPSTPPRVALQSRSNLLPWRWEPGLQQPGPLWLMGCHGGAGVSTVASVLAASARPATLPIVESRHWPLSPGPVPYRVVLVTRTHGVGIQAVQTAAAMWATGELWNIQLLGVVLVDDGPRLTPAMTSAWPRIKGLTPRTWHLRWQDRWRDLVPGRDPYPTDLRIRRTAAAIIKAAA